MARDSQNDTVEVAREEWNELINDVVDLRYDTPSRRTERVSEIRDRMRGIRDEPSDSIQPNYGTFGGK